MSRAVKEWVGKTDDSTAPPRVRVRVVLSQKGICACGCGMKLGVAGERIDIDHTVALILGGENRESNLRALRPACHKAKTRQDVAQKSIESRKRAKHMGFHKTKQKIPGSKGTGWRKKLDGTVVRVSE